MLIICPQKIHKGCKKQVQPINHSIQSIDCTREKQKWYQPRSRENYCHVCEFSTELVYTFNFRHHVCPPAVNNTKNTKIYMDMRKQQKRHWLGKLVQILRIMYRAKLHAHNLTIVLKLWPNASTSTLYFVFIRELSCEHDSPTTKQRMHISH